MSTTTASSSRTCASVLPRASTRCTDATSSAATASGGFSITGICKIVDLDSLDVEVDVRFENGKFFLGHDFNQFEIDKKFEDVDFAVTDISHSKSIIELEGNDAKEVLKKGCPFNFNILTKNMSINSAYNGISFIVDMVENEPEKARIFSLRSFGESLYHSITDASLEFGYKCN